MSVAEKLIALMRECDKTDITKICLEMADKGEVPHELFRLGSILRGSEENYVLSIWEQYKILERPDYREYYDSHQFTDEYISVCMMFRDEPSTYHIPMSFVKMNREERERFIQVELEAKAVYSAKAQAILRERRIEALERELQALKGGNNV